MQYKFHKIDPNRDESYIDSPNWIKNKKATTNPINKKNNKCFQYAVTVALYKTGKNTEGTSKSKPFIDKHNWEGINYSSEKED